MGTIGVQMNHSCGHAGYHVIEECKNHSQARKVYDLMGSKPCPNCQKKPGFIIKDGMWVPNAKMLEVGLFATRYGAPVEQPIDMAVREKRKEAARKMVRRAIIRRTRG